MLDAVAGEKFEQGEIDGSGEQGYGCDDQLYLPAFEDSSEWFRCQPDIEIKACREPRTDHGPANGQKPETPSCGFSD